MNSIVTISPKRLIKILVVTGTVLGCVDLVGNLLYRWEMRLFNINLFQVIASLGIMRVYVLFLFLICSILLACISRSKKLKESRFVNHWKVLAVVFFGLFFVKLIGIEATAFMFVRPSSDSVTLPILTFAVAVVLIIIFLRFYARFLFCLDRTTRRLFLVAGGTYLSGAIIMNTISKLLWRLLGWVRYSSYGKALPYALAQTIEELIEMSGILVFIFVLLSYLQNVCLTGGKGDMSAQ